MKHVLWFLVVVAALGTAACDSGATGKEGVSCSVAETADGDVTVTCDDGTQSTLHPPKLDAGSAGDGGAGGGSCHVTQSETSVTIRCPGGSTATWPIAQPRLDGGVAPNTDGAVNPSCTVTQASDGSITIQCPDGTKTYIPGPDSPASQARLLGATAASCGTCHDASSAKAHFKVMTVASDAGPQETCGTCHRESSLEPVSRAHARLELGAPGLLVSILEASVDTVSRRPRVRLRITDREGAALARDGVSISFLVAKVAAVSDAIGAHTVAGAYQNYLKRSVTQSDPPSYPLNGAMPRKVDQPSTESSTSGVFTTIESGVYDYTFSYALPEGYDASASHMVALYATRSVEGVRFVANAERFFVPSDANATPLRRDAVHTETCNNCHNPLSAHGGARQEVQLCLGCHTQGAIDPESGNSLDFNVMIHRIHRGRDLPSVRGGTPYSIVGYGLSLLDFSKVGFPQSIQNCQSCHTDDDGERWVSNGVRAACTSCHENVDKTEGEGSHPFPLNPDADCGNANCHGPGGNVADAREAHKTQLNDLSSGIFDLTILSVSAADADSPVQVRIRAHTGTRQSGAMLPVTSPGNLSTLSVFINGPNTGFELSGNTIVKLTKSELVSLAADAQKPGELTFSLPRSMRQTVGGLGDPDVDSYTLSLRATYDPTPSTAPDDDRLDMRLNPAAAFSASEEVVGRRPVVETGKCNACHGELSQHSGDNLARSVEQCTMCHSGSLDTRVRQSANKVAGVTTSLRLSTLVHRIHASGVATTPYSVFADGTGAPYPVRDLSEVPFPGDVRDCDSCHTHGTNFLPLPALDPPTQTIVLDADGNVVGP